MKKNIELHLQAQCYPLYDYQNYSRYLTTHQVELTNPSSKNPSAYKDLQTYGIGVSSDGKKFSTIPGDLVTQFTINKEVKVRGGPMRGGYSISFDVENDFDGKLLMSQMRMKTASTHKEATYGKMQRREEQIPLLKNLKTSSKKYGNRNGGEVPVCINNGLLSSREKGEEC